jgi:hypothetical protein
MPGYFNAMWKGSAVSYPLMWKSYRDNGYVTTFMDDYYKHIFKPFMAKKQWPDHFMGEGSIEMHKYFDYSKCYDKTIPMHKVLRMISNNILPTYIVAVHVS